MTEVRGSTPSQTVGPFLSIGLSWPDGSDLIAADTPAAIRIIGRLTDGAGRPVPDGLVEIWQAAADGRFDHPDDPRGAVAHPGFRGFGRCPTDERGEFWFRTVKPGPLPAEGGTVQAPHIDVSVFARGMLDRVITRIYFPDEQAANEADPVLSSLTGPQRQRLIAQPEADGSLRFDVCLQGADETTFFRV